MDLNQEIPATTRASLRPIIIGGAFGNLIEWYDWTIYGLLAPVFAAQIVPGQQSRDIVDRASCSPTPWGS